MNSLALKQQEHDRRVSAIATVLFHVLLLVLFLFFGLKQPNPLPKEEAIELAFEDAGGPSGGDSGPAQIQAPAPPVEEVTPEEPEPIATEAESPVAIPKAEKPKPKPQPKPPERKPDSRSLFAPSTNGKPNASPTFTPGTGSGSSDGSGDGTGGGGGAFTGKGFQGRLSGRGLVRGPSISEKPSEGGRVSLDIFVDRTGKVTHVVQNLDRSTTTSQVLFNLARKAALQCTFSAKPDGPAEQKGEMTFIFELQ